MYKLLTKVQKPQRKQQDQQQQQQERQQQRDANEPRIRHRHRHLHLHPRLLRSRVSCSSWQLKSFYAKYANQMLML